LAGVNNQSSECQCNTSRSTPATVTLLYSGVRWILFHAESHCQKGPQVMLPQWTPSEDKRHDFPYELVSLPASLSRSFPDPSLSCPTDVSSSPLPHTSAPARSELLRCLCPPLQLLFLCLLLSGVPTLTSCAVHLFQYDLATSFTLTSRCYRQSFPTRPLSLRRSYAVVLIPFPTGNGPFGFVLFPRCVFPLLPRSMLEFD